MTNTIIKASAGSGKTFRLSNEYLNLLFGAASSDAVVDTILASTFTRKAAGEITDRIFTKLADVALDPQKRDELRQHLRYPQTHHEEAELLERLARLARTMYRMRVGTLDAYSNRIATAFALELRLPPGWSILDGGDFPRLLIEAIRHVFESSPQDVRRLMALIQGGDASASLVSALTDIAAQGVALVRDTPREAWEHDAPERLQEVVQCKLTSAQLRDWVERLQRITSPKHKTFEKTLSTLVGLFFDDEGQMVSSVDDVAWDVVRSNGIVNNRAKGMETYYSKPIDPELASVADAFLAHARAHIVEALVQKTAATRAMLERIADQLDTLMLRQRKFRFEDITRQVAATPIPARQLHHRLNAETRHLLLDEFQDTSKPQWDILKSLAQGVVQQENATFFCVGDVKQAIYSWRGGVAAIFDTMQENLARDGATIINTSMNETRRSTQPIVDAVNSVFNRIAANEIVKDVSPEAGEAWQRRFQEHTTAKIGAGYCTLEQSPEFSSDSSDDLDEDAELDSSNTESNDDSSDGNDDSGGDSSCKNKAHLKYVADRIESLLKVQQNRPTLKNGIGVLVRTNGASGAIVTELKRRGIETRGGGGMLIDSAAVRHVVSALTFADHPGDSIARFHLQHGPLAASLGLDSKKDVRCAHDLRRAITTDGYGETVRKCVEQLAPSCDSVELARLQKLVELAYCYDTEAEGVRTTPFLDRVRSARFVSPHAANIDVMTYHAAKGLEFDIVVLPELASPLKGREQDVKFVVSHEQPSDRTSPIDFVLCYANKDVQDLLPERYQKAFALRTQGVVEESLSMLYVAMTRAIHQLVMIVAPPQPKQTKNTLAALLREALVETDPLRVDLLASPSTIPRPRWAASVRLPEIQTGFSITSGERVLYAHGDPNWFATFTEEPRAASLSEETELACRFADRVVLHHVPRIAPSRQEIESDVGERDTFTEWEFPSAAAVSDEAARVRHTAAWGTAFHACFEHGAAWLDEPDGADTLSDDNLVALVQRTLHGEKIDFAPRDVVRLFRAACERPSVRAVLSRSRYDAPTIELERERRFAVWCEEKILHGSIDRLVVQRDTTGAILGIEVIDFKSDRHMNHLAAHREQMQRYRQAMSILFRCDLAKIKATLVFVTLGEVVSLGG